MELELRSVELHGAHEAGGAPRVAGVPPPSWTGGGPPGLNSFASIFNIFQKIVPWSFRSFRELLFLHINNTMAILLKTVSVRFSSIQIMQVRVQNKGKSVWKSRYDGDVSRPKRGRAPQRSIPRGTLTVVRNDAPALSPRPHRK